MFQINNISNRLVKIIAILFLNTIVFQAFSGVVVDVEPTACQYAKDGKITVTASGPSGTYTITLSGNGKYEEVSGNSATFSDLGIGIYTISVNTSQSCDFSKSYQVKADPDKIKINFDVENEVCMKENGSITANATGSSIVSYKWNTGDEGATLSNISAGSYSVTVEDDNGCQKSGGGSVGRDNIDFVLDFDSEDVTCHGDSDGSASVSATDASGLGGGSFEYEWSNGGSGASISGLDGGAYSVTVSSDEGCATSGSVGVGEPSELSMSISGGAFNISFCSNGGPPELTLTGGASGGTPPYSYSPASAQMTVSSSGPYSMNVTDDHGCTDDATTFVFFVPIVCSRDPNDIAGPAGYGEKQYVGKKETLPYKIRFKNDPEFATAPAQVVYITMPIDASYDIYSLRLTEFGFGSFRFPVEVDKPYYRTQVDVSDSLGVIVDLIAGVDVRRREIFWRFSSLDPKTKLAPTDPQKGFLLVNDSLTHIGEGYVDFTISPYKTVKTGDTLVAKAVIQFDDNDTIQTNTWVNTIDASLPESSIKDLPLVSASDSLLISISATDNNESGVSHVDVYVSVNGNIPFLFQSLNAADTTIVYVGEIGNSYGFFTLATDFTGNREAMKTVAEETVTIKNIFITEINSSLCAGDSVLFANSYLYEKGIYTDSLLSIDGTDSLIYFNLEVYNKYLVDDTVIICSKDSILIGNKYYNENGIYIDSLETIYGCDSVININLKVLEKLVYEQNVIICKGDTVSINDTLVSDNYYAVDSLVTKSGCDSIMVYKVTVNPSYIIDTSISICEGDSYFVQGLYRTESGIYTDSLEATSGCDSIIVTELNVKPASDTLLDEVLCMGDSILFDGKYLTETGVYIDSLQNALGCDSIVTLSLNVNKSWLAESDVTICFGSTYFINGKDQTEAGTYTDSLETVTGCDSIIVVHLAFTDKFTKEKLVSICKGETYFAEGADQKLTGEYRDTISGGNNCDTVILTKLTVDEKIDIAVYKTVCFGDSLFVEGNYQNEAGTYYDTLRVEIGCDTIYATHLTISEQNIVYDSIITCAGGLFLVGDSVYTESGTYINIVDDSTGCKKTIVTNLTVLQESISNQTVTICKGESYFAGGAEQTTAGKYSDTLVSVNNCDSIVNTEIIVKEFEIININAYTCPEDSVDVGDYYAHETGIYKDTVKYAIGCDTIFVYNVVVSDFVPKQVTMSICAGDSAFLAGMYQTESGVYYDTLIVADACDTIITTQLTVNPLVETLVYVDICAGDTAIVADTFAITTTMFEHTFVNMQGCDSIVKTYVTVNPTHNIVIEKTIYEGDSILFAGKYQHLDGTYTDSLQTSTGCDSIIVMKLTTIENNAPVVSEIPTVVLSAVTPKATVSLNLYVTDDHVSASKLTWTAAKTTNVTVSISADNVATITLLNPNWKGTEVVTFTVTDDGGKQSVIELTVEAKGEVSLVEISKDLTLIVYPNPNNGEFKVELIATHIADVKLRLLDQAGRVLETRSTSVQTRHVEEFEVTQKASGSYFIEISTESFTYTHEIIIVK
ncbi:MAG: T9SS type A sorting domain-containing protein [Bacteroidales bacterium]|nr:T9SS type A sorting domain-containing protein [Bacteroidales bacterium]